MAAAELGSPRKCLNCGKTKEVAQETYALSKKDGASLRGWSTVCRVCQAGGDVQPRKPKGVLGTTARAQADEFQALIDEMYSLPANAERDNVVARLRGVFEENYSEDPHAQFRAFTRILAPLVNNWKEPGPVHDDIIEGLINGGTNTLIMATRNTAKSTLTCMWILLQIYLDPLITILSVSRSSALAKRNLRFIRQWITNSPFVAHLDPSLNEKCLDSAEEFVVPAALDVNTGGSTLVSLGRTSQLTGRRAHIVLSDDIEGPDDNDPDKVTALAEMVAEYEHIMHPGGRTIALGTPQSEYSLYAQQAASGEWNLFKARMFEVEVDEKGKETFRSRWPARFTDADLADKKRKMTKKAWDLHWMLICDPKKLLEKPLKIKDMVLVDWPVDRPNFPLVVYPGTAPANVVQDVTTWGAPDGDVWIGPSQVDDTVRPYVLTTAACDPASGLAGRDAIGLAIISITQGGQAVIRHVEGVRGVSLEANLVHISHRLKEFHVHRLGVEERRDSLFGRTLAAECAKRGWPITPEQITTGQMGKGQRIIEALAPVMSQGRLVMLRDVALGDHGGELVNEMVSCSYDGRIGARYDDIVDALSHAVNMCGEMLTGDVIESITEARVNLDALYDLSIREGGVKPGDMTEQYLEKSEAELKLMSRLDHALMIRDRDLASGRHDPAIVRQIERIQKSLKQLRLQEAMAR